MGLDNEKKPNEALPYVHGPDSAPPKAPPIRLTYGADEASGVPSEVKQALAEGGVVGLPSREFIHGVMKARSEAIKQTLGLSHDDQLVLRAERLQNERDAALAAVEKLKKELAESRAAFDALQGKLNAKEREARDYAQKWTRADLISHKLADENMKLRQEIADLCNESNHAEGYPVPKSSSTTVASAPSEGRAETVLEEAARITSVDRQKQYGPPEDSFALIAEMWAAYLVAAGWTQGQRAFGSREVAMLMVLMKVARDVQGSGKRDNLVDIAGYARCAEMASARGQSQ
jgi:hypothetical protein